MKERERENIFFSITSTHIFSAIFFPFLSLSFYVFSPNSSTKPITTTMTSEKDAPAVPEKDDGGGHTTPSAGELFVNLITDKTSTTTTTDCAGGGKKDAMENFIAAVSRENQHSRTDVVTAARDCRDFPNDTLLIDARSPGEFRKGHIPNARNVALFEDDEREVVGILFAKKGRKAAMARGMEFVREKWEQLIANAQAEVDLKRKTNGERTKIRVYVHCWRGGMRSLSLGWLFGERLRKEDVEFVRVVNGGYKAFRTWILNRCGDPLKVDERLLNGGKGKGNGGGSGGGGGDEFGLDEDDLLDDANAADNNKNHPKNRLQNNATSTGTSKHANDDPFAPQVLTNVPAPRVCIIGGRTGVGKTRCLLALEKLQNEQIIDLEGLANHSGSAFGWVGKAAQPTSEHYGNEVAFAWDALDPKRWVYIEDEGPHVGKCSVDPKLFQRMRKAPLILRLVCPLELRVQTLVNDYATDELRAQEGWMEGMREACEKMTKRIGSEKQKKLKKSLEGGDWASVAEQLLEYYDALYDKHLAMKRDDSKKHRKKQKESRENPANTDATAGDETIGEGEVSLNDSMSAGENKERQGTVVDVEVFPDETGRDIDEARLCRDVQMAVALYELTSQKIDEELEDVQNAIDG